MGCEDKFVLLAKILTPGAAHIIRSALEAHDIPCLILDDHPSGLGVGIGIINARVMVPESFLDQASQLLEDLEKENHDLDS